jgi:PAS domain S-box-containing protein
MQQLKISIMNEPRARILIVEDMLVTAEQIKVQLEEMGYSVCGIADTGDKAKALARTSSPDLILMDINLKGDSNGISAAHGIQRFLDVPVIYLTAYVDPATFIRARETGPYGFISKPYEDKDLFYSIEIALNKHSMERNLRDSELRYRRLVENIPHLICRFDPDFNLTFVNDSYCRYFGRTSGELLGTSFFEHIPGRVREIVRGKIRSLTIDNPVASYEHEVIMPDDSVRWQRRTDSAIFNSEGAPGEYQSIGEDITAIRLLEQEVIRVTDNERRRISRDLHDSLGQRLSYLGFVAEMHKKELAGKAYDNFQHIDSIIGLVRESVDHTRLIAKGLQPVALDPGGFVEAVREYIKEMKRLLDVKVRLEKKGEIILEDQFIAEHLFYIVREAISNAARHGACRGVIDVEMNCNDSDLVITVSNRIGKEHPVAGANDGMGLNILQHRAHLIGAVIRKFNDQRVFGLEISLNTSRIH